ncbi:MAG: glutamate-1-semialdehyde 2,1-aminomutase [Acidobacteria bacterium]|nr:glutamate-1-semialdehyde 2,1-aminomutase [Acidobacteriota bacterium]
MGKDTRSARLFERASKVMPGGVNSPVRAFKAVGGTPRFVTRGKGAYIEDEDGRRYLDYVMSWGPLIHGHAPKGLLTALRKAATRGTSFGAPTRLEVEMAETVRSLLPSMELVRFTSSGTEAAMSVLRVARAATGRDAVVKFAGCYHGHADGFLVEAGSGATALGVPTSPGVPAALAAMTLTARYNDLASVEAVVAAQPGGVAAILVEPIAGNMGVVPPVPGFLDGLRDLCDRTGALLVFDEVISGFRASRGGAQHLLDVRPDLTCLGKIIGGGLPVGAYGGRQDLMRLVAPDGPVYQAGTLSGNPLAMTAGLWALGALSDKLYEKLERLGSRLAEGLADAAHRAGCDISINRVGSLLTVFFTDRPVLDYDDAKLADTAAYGRFFQSMLTQGIYLPPSQFEGWFLSGAHSTGDIDVTIKAARKAFRKSRP